MEKIALKDIINIYEYEKTREGFRRRVIDLKRARRIAVGEKLSFVFENRETVLFQIQEIVRAERIVDEDKIVYEVQIYNELIPEPGELSATMLIEIEDQAHIKEELYRFQGIDEGNKVFIAVGEDERIAGIFETGRSKADKISGVHYVRFRFNPAQILALREGRKEICLVVDHLNYRARAKVENSSRRAWIQDLS